MNDRPTAVELLREVEHFLEREVVPNLEGPRRFHARIAANVVAIVAREIETEEAHLRDEWQRLGLLLCDSAPPPAERGRLREGVRSRNEALVARIRAGDADGGDFREGVLAHLQQTVDEKLEVSRPPRQRG